MLGSTTSILSCIINYSVFDMFAVGFFIAGETSSPSSFITQYVYVETADDGQSHLALNHVSISNSISTLPGSMLPGAAHGSAEIDARFVKTRLDSCSVHSLCGRTCRRRSRTEMYEGDVAAPKRDMRIGEVLL